MPVYKVTIILKANSGNPQAQRQEAFRQYKETDIELVWHKQENKCKAKWAGRLETFDCVMISKRSADYLRYLNQLKKASADKGGMPGAVVTRLERVNGKGPGKYRNLNA